MASSVEESEQVTTRLIAEDRSAPSEPTPSSDSDTVQRIEAEVRQRLFVSKPPAPRIGRFVVLHEIGRGGMGMVYVAYDEQLDRKVAVKVMLDEELPTEDEQARFQREAQALARLSHPHVVTVHEVGESDGSFFLAMEYVHGKSLSAWLRTDPGPALVLDAFRQAGQGLMAAHSVDLVHRDFKPANVMRTDDGTVKVLDFGLARVADELLDESSELGSLSEISNLSSSITRTGAVMGTPAYMAPEQFFGEPVDARSDQYSFCVSLWQGLTGARPFTSSKLDELQRAKIQGPPPWPDDAPSVRRQVIEALRRGLSPDPDARFESMAPLLELLREPSARPGRWAIPAVAVAVLGLGGSWAFAHYAQVKDRCTGAEAKLAEVWNDDRRHDVKAALDGTGLLYAAQAWERVEPRLDDYAQAWATRHTEVCEATTVRGEQSTEVMDLRMGCLERHRLALRATVDVLVDADDTVVRNATRLATGLPLLSRCDDLDVLRIEMPPPDSPDIAEEVEALREEMAETAVIHTAGRYAQALEQMELLMKRVETSGYAPLLAEAKETRGRSYEQLGRYEDAARDLGDAYELALEHGHDRMAAKAAELLAFVVGYTLGQHSEGQRLARTAMALARRAHDDRTLAMAMNSLSTIYGARGEHETAGEILERAIPIASEAWGETHAALGLIVGNLAVAYHSMGDEERALEQMERSLWIHETARGPDHPAMAGAFVNLSTLYFERGDLKQSQHYAERALRLWEDSLGPDHPNIAQALQNLGQLLIEQGKHDEARPHVERAMRILEGTQGDNSEDLAALSYKMATIHVAKGNLELARESWERALRQYDETLGKDNRSSGQVLIDLARLMRTMGDFEVARAHAERAVSIWTKERTTAEGSGPSSTELAHAEKWLARARFELARVLWNDDVEQPRARELAERARDVLVTHGELDDELGDVITEIEQWLEKHPAP